jgi:hypothetical protein
MGMLIAYLLGILTATKPEDYDRDRDKGIANFHEGQSFPQGPISVICLPRTRTDEEQAEKKKDKRRKAMSFWIRIAGFVVLAIYAGFTILIWSANKKAADATVRAADSQVAANRAWIVPDSPPQHKQVIEEANLEWHNAGKTPAISVFSWKEYFPGGFPARMNSCPEVSNAVKKQPSDSLQYQAFIAEGGRYEVGLDHAPVWVGQQPIFIHGCIWYTDVSSNTEKSSEFFYVAFQNKYSFPISDGISLFFDRPFTYK